MRTRNSSSLISVGLFLAICCLQVVPSVQECTGSCEQIWEPVCGSDGKTYANRCIAKCAGTAVKHTGRCKTFASTGLSLFDGAFACTDNCEQLWDPVCGSDGKTYANKCIAKCAGASVKHTGRCKTFASSTGLSLFEGAFACTDNCEQLWDPVCGNNGKTYANKCIAKCAGASVKHTGRCKTFSSASAFSEGAFACTDNCEQKWDPVCGSNGKTYANKCVAKCAGASVKHTGRCKTFAAHGPAFSEGAFACTDNCEQKWDPVCGSDGKTYANKCIAKCAGTSVKHTGRCKAFAAHGPASTVFHRYCNGVYDPVCGVDNRTYANACLAHRANVSIKHPGPCMG